ncbi:dynein regulatory complex subunit 3-like isoform X2 [Chelonus insularis]|nr:dynein regulatory complex subunit 3-like isoform X2 [Chelonus insularis]XP_034939743.1 dynein regulatory complex subunit 3-like isoform X2 [Chelonus insularis]
MKNLVKLSLSHNLIENIENLDGLLQLKELDFSFNRIKVMKNLNHLVKLELLYLTGNQIIEIQEIDKLENLTIFSIADNNIETWDHVIYLRKFKKLRSVNINGNPCIQQENYKKYFKAFLPQVIYFSYVLINKDDHDYAAQLYRRDILRIEKEELETKISQDKIHNQQQKTAQDFVAFVENLDEEEFFNILFQHDTGGLIIKTINDDTLNAFEDFKLNFTNVCHKLYKFGINQHHQRLEEIKEFNSVIENARNNLCKKSRKIIDFIIEERNLLLRKFKNFDNDECVKTNLKTEISKVQSTFLDDNNIVQAREFVNEFNDFLSKMWTQLLEDQIFLHEQYEDLIEIFKNNLTDMKDVFLDNVRTVFTQMRNFMIQYRDNINRIVTSFINSIREESLIPNHLVNICGDLNTFHNILTTSYDIHLQIIDTRESTIINRVNLWSESLIEELNNAENMLYRQWILEISHFLQFQRNQIHHGLFENNKLAANVAAVLDG